MIRCSGTIRFSINKLEVNFEQTLVVCVKDLGRFSGKGN